jgi:hypothetical protein
LRFVTGEERPNDPLGAHPWRVGRLSRGVARGLPVAERDDAAEPERRHPEPAELIAVGRQFRLAPVLSLERWGTVIQFPVLLPQQRWRFRRDSAAESDLLDRQWRPERRQPEFFLRPAR